MGILIAFMYSVLTSMVPQLSPGTDAWNLDVTAKTSVPIHVLSAKFYKMPGDPGPHVGQVWIAGTKVAEVTFTGETASGWQVQALAGSGIPVPAGATFLVGVPNPAGAHYAKLAGVFATPLVDGVITYMSGSYGPQGVPSAYPGSSTPTSYFRDFDYSVDIVPTIVMSHDGTPGGYNVKTDSFAGGPYQFGVYLIDQFGNRTLSPPLSIDMPNQLPAVQLPAVQR